MSGQHETPYKHLLSPLFNTWPAEVGPVTREEIHQMLVSGLFQNKESLTEIVL